MSYLKITWFFSIGFFLFVLAVTSVSADIYRYIDKDGVWHFSNIKSNKHYELFIREVSRNAPTYGAKAIHITKYDEIILQASKQFEVERALIKAIIKAESDFDHQAVSSKGALGLMQLMPETADEMNVKDPFDPGENIIGGTRYLSLLLKRFNNDKQLALAAYNAGPDEVESSNGIPPFPETKTFVEKVMDYYHSYHSANR